MTHMKLKLGLAGLVLAGALGCLVYAGAQKGWVYTLGVDTYISNVERQGERVRLCGLVGEKDLLVQKSQLLAVFQLKGEKNSMPVKYKGAVPDMFKAGAEVLVEGKRDAAGVFQADVLMTKCASKYEERPQGHPTTGKDATAAPATGGQG